MAKKRFAHVGIGGRARMYYEAISQILPDVKLIISTGDGEYVDMILPIEPITGGNAQ